MAKKYSRPVVNMDGRAVLISSPEEETQRASEAEGRAEEGAAKGQLVAGATPSHRHRSAWDRLTHFRSRA